MYKLPVDRDDKKKLILVDEVYRRDFYRYIESKRDQKRKKYIYRYFKDFYFVKYLIMNVNKFVVFTTVGTALLSYFFASYKIGIHFHLALFASPVINVLTFVMTINLNSRYSVLSYLATLKSNVFSQVCQLREWQRVFTVDKKTVFKLQNSLYKLTAQIIHYMQTVNRKKRKQIEKCIYREIVLYCKYIEELYNMKHFIKVALMFVLMKTVREMMRTFTLLKTIRDYRAPLITRAFIFSSMCMSLVPTSLIIVHLTKGLDREPRVSYATAVGLITGLVYGNLASLISVMHDPFGVDMDQVDLKQTLLWLVKTVEVYRENEHNTILFRNDTFFEWRTRNGPVPPVSAAEDCYPNLQNHDFILAHYEKLGEAYSKASKENRANAFELDDHLKVMLV